MLEPEKKEEGDEEQDERLEEAKKTVDTAALTLIALGASGVLFWVVSLACNRWNIEPGQGWLLAVIGIACSPLLCLAATRLAAQAELPERAFKASCYVCLATAVLCVGGLQAAHVARHGWSHWGCLGAGQKWRDKHSENQGTVVGFRCGDESCTRERVLNYMPPRMVVEFDRPAWYEARPDAADDDCRNLTLAIVAVESGAWLPDLGRRVAVGPDFCHPISGRPFVWYPIR